MQLPFSREQFLDVFRAYNDAIGIMPALLVGLAIALVAAAYSRSGKKHRAIAAGLAVLWIWSGAVYHWGFFAQINPAAQLFGALFLVQAGVLLALGVLRSRLKFEPRGQRSTVMGWALIAYALVGYPLLGAALGHGYPNGPSFGAPCPTTIFFFGLMFWVEGKIPVMLVALPVAWAVLGTSAAVQLGIPEDFGLAVAAVLVAGELMRRRLVTSATPRRPPAAGHKGITRHA